MTVDGASRLQIARAIEEVGIFERIAANLLIGFALMAFGKACIRRLLTPYKSWIVGALPCGVHRYRQGRTMPTADACLKRSYLLRLASRPTSYRNLLYNTENQLSQLFQHPACADHCNTMVPILVSLTIVTGFRYWSCFPQ